MAAAVDAGHCEVVERSNATVDDVFNVLQHPRYRNRVAIFHYGGHAGGRGLLLETPAGEATVLAHAGALARFLGGQRGLELVFLNGCSTRGQVRGLLDAGVPAVIATSQRIDDEVATEFSARRRGRNRDGGDQGLAQLAGCIGREEGMVSASLPNGGNPLLRIFRIYETIFRGEQRR